MNSEKGILRRVIGGQLCAGCGLCASLSGNTVKMEMQPPGYARPNSTNRLSEAHEAVLEAACPGATVAQWDSYSAADPYWGPHRASFIGWAEDEQVRFQASSGGVITALAIHALRTGFVDRVVHVRPDPASAIGNIVVCSNNETDILAGAGSRYAASSPLEHIHSILSDGGAVAFVGKPCDISALRNLAQFDGRVSEHVRLMLSFFCAGVPSRDGAERILRALGVESSKVSKFRYRGYGWPGEAAATMFDGAEARMSYEESWGDYLSKEVQFRCKVCPDAVGGVADIACADAWHADKMGYPSFKEQDGRSLVLARTEVGERLLASAVASASVQVRPLDIIEIEGMQPSQARRKRLVKSRVKALAIAMQPRPKMGGLMVSSASKRADILEGLRATLGTLRRVLYNRR